MSGPPLRVRVLGEPLDYRDGSEHHVLAAVEAATDRSSCSDELAASIVDWPTRYHLSRERAQLLLPLEVGAGDRVLDVGAGTGVLARALAERGAEVVALEGSRERAEVAAARCAGLDGVQVVCGSLTDLEDRDGDTAAGGSGGFDLVLVVGVLEYSAASIGGSEGPAALLARVRRLMRPGAAVAVAIENRLGLKYLLGHPEDHLGEPWVGVADYPGGHDVRTWSRRELHGLLAEAGLTRQRWLHPFPDYKLPTAVLADELYDRPDAEWLVDQLVRAPVRDPAFPDARPVGDPRRAHRGFVRAGLGPQVANSFLVVAGDDEATLPVAGDTLAWLGDRERRRRWRRTKRLVAGADGLHLDAESVDGPDVRAEGWLTQQTERSDPWRPGRTIEQLVLDRLAAHDVFAAAEALRRWRDHLRARESDTAHPETTHPYLGAGTERVLPPDCLDVEAANFVADGDDIAQVDSEWRAAGGVDAELVRVRALRYLAERLVLDSGEHPWGAATVDDVTARLGALCGVSVDDAALRRMHHAEGRFQAVVRGVDAEAVARDLAASGRSPSPARAAGLGGPRSPGPAGPAGSSAGSPAGEREPARSVRRAITSRVARALRRLAGPRR